MNKKTKNQYLFSNSEWSKKKSTGLFTSFKYVSQLSFKSEGWSCMDFRIHTITLIIILIFASFLLRYPFRFHCFQLDSQKQMAPTCVENWKQLTGTWTFHCFNELSFIKRPSIRGGKRRVGYSEVTIAALQFARVPSIDRSINPVSINASTTCYFLFCLFFFFFLLLSCQCEYTLFDCCLHYFY